MSWGSGGGVVRKVAAHAAQLTWIVVGAVLAADLKEASPPSSWWGMYWSWPIVVWTWVGTAAFIARYWPRLAPERSTKVAFVYFWAVTGTVLACAFLGGLRHSLGGTSLEGVLVCAAVVVGGLVFAVVTWAICELLLARWLD